MSERIDRKLHMVTVGRYGYRHEAEFAAGFLDDAGIPYRLQIDDPAMGLSISTSATIYVLGSDERRARDILGTDRVRSAQAAPIASGSVARAPRSSRSVERAPRESGGPLPLRSRVLSLAAGGGVGVLSVLVDLGSLAPVAIVSGVILVLVAIVGRAPGPVARLLAALSGEAP